MRERRRCRSRERARQRGRQILCACASAFVARLCAVRAREQQSRQAQVAAVSVSVFRIKGGRNTLAFESRFCNVMRSQQQISGQRTSARACVRQNLGSAAGNIINNERAGCASGDVRVFGVRCASLDVTRVQWIANETRGSGWAQTTQNTINKHTKTRIPNRRQLILRVERVTRVLPEFCNIRQRLRSLDIRQIKLQTKQAQ